jgi:hypothetical protein
MARMLYCGKSSGRMMDMMDNMGFGNMVKRMPRAIDMAGGTLMGGMMGRRAVGGVMAGRAGGVLASGTAAPLAGPAMMNAFGFPLLSDLPFGIFLTRWLAVITGIVFWLSGFLE